MYSTSAIYWGRESEEGKEGQRAGKYPYLFMVKMGSSGEKNKLPS